MDIARYLEYMGTIQEKFLEFVESYENVEEYFLEWNLEVNKIRDNKNDLSLFLYFVASICTNHHRGQNFFDRIYRVLRLVKDDITKNFANSETFNIFKGNKRILLFLIEENVMIFDEYVAKKITQEKYLKKKYPQYFAPEIKTFKDEIWFPKYKPSDKYNKNEWIDEIKNEIPVNFSDLRRIGENESYICKLIRDDNAEEFVAHMSRGNLPFNLRIKLSIYETNSFLIKQASKMNGVLLIEYAAFFGSIQIFQYLQMQGVKLTSSLWLYAIHGQNPEIIHILEKCIDVPPSTAERKIYEDCFKESIKCNHNAIANYLENNYPQNCDSMSKHTFIQSTKYYNFLFIQNEHVNESSFYQLCEYDYYFFVDNLLANRDINVSSKII